MVHPLGRGRGADRGARRDRPRAAEDDGRAKARARPGEGTALAAPMMRRLVLVALFCTTAMVARAGPPYITDDPEPVDYQHWEVYLASMTQHTPDDFAGTLPHVEINYGIVPDAFDAAAGEPRNYGLGDIELGVKYRFLKEADDHPEIGIFPLVEVPTGDENKGLGTGHTQLFLPVWMQKSW